MKLMKQILKLFLHVMQNSNLFNFKINIKDACVYICNKWNNYMAKKIDSSSVKARN